LVGFNGVSKYITASVFLSDMTLHLPEIRAKSILSVHSIVNAADRNLNDFQIGFNSFKIIKKLEVILGIGFIELYKTNVQVFIPDKESYYNCEYNNIVKHIVKYGDLRMIFDKHSKEQKDKELNLIKRSLRESQTSIQTSLDENENKISRRDF
jgi:hypothetical protein